MVVISGNVAYVGSVYVGCVDIVHEVTVVEVVYIFFLEDLEDHISE